MPDGRPAAPRAARRRGENVLFALRRLSLGLFLAALASAVLLLSDAHQRRPKAQPRPRVAVFQIASRPVLDDSVRGVLEGLAAAGYREGTTLEVKRYNAEGDLPTANAIAREIVGGGFDVAITASTPALQALANANRDGRVLHVFCTVTDPFEAKVGLVPGDPLGHPRHLVGLGTFQPVRELLRLARRLRPELKTVGTVWCPAESSAEACVKVAREESAALGLRLLEANADSSADVAEAARSLTSRGVEALWVGGDNVVETAVSSLVKVAREAKVPLLANAPTHAEAGALVGLGADYVEVGRRAGDLASRLLAGLDPATVRVENVAPPLLALNLSALSGLRDRWNVPDDVRSEAAVVIDEKGVRTARDSGSAAAGTAGAVSPIASGRRRITLVQLVSGPAIDATREGMLRGLAEGGLVPGRDVEVKVRDAQGDLSALPALVDAARADRADLVLTITTPALQAAMARLRDRPVVFGLAIDPLLAGDDGTHERHRSNVAGIYDRSPFEPLLDLLRQLLPRARTIGTLFSPAEPNSVLFRDELARVARSRGLALVAVASDSPAGVADAALALVGRRVDAVCQVNDNLHEASFAGIAAAARRARVPVFAFSSPLVHEGAAVALANDHSDGGREAGRIAARVLRGDNPASIPYRGITKTVLALNPAAAAEAGLTLPAELLSRAAVVARRPPASAPGTSPAAERRAGPPVPPPLGRTANLQVLHFAESTMVEEAMAGLKAELPRTGLVEGRDYELTVRNAQGEMSNLVSLLDAAVATRPDVLLVTSTPTLQAALKRVKGVPIVFNVVANPVLAGAGTSFADHAPNVTGISTESDFAGMARVVRECLPRARRVGTLFNPGEANSVFNRDGTAKALAAVGIELVSVATSTPAEIPDAALALSGRGLDAICQVNGNLHDSGFSGIAQAARKAKLPLFAFTSAQAVSGGAAVAVARDYGQAGADQARLAARVLRGESPASIPFALVSRTSLVVNPEAAAALGMTIPPALLARADRVVGR